MLLEESVKERKKMQRKQFKKKNRKSTATPQLAAPEIGERMKCQREEKNRSGFSSKVSSFVQILVFVFC